MAVYYIDLLEPHSISNTATTLTDWRWVTTTNIWPLESRSWPHKSTQKYACTEFSTVRPYSWVVLSNYIGLLPDRQTDRHIVPSAAPMNGRGVKLNANTVAGYSHW